MFVDLTWYQVVQQTTDDSSHQYAGRQQHLKHRIKSLHTSLYDAAVFRHPASQNQRKEQAEADDVQVPRTVQVHVLKSR